MLISKFDLGLTKSKFSLFLKGQRKSDFTFNFKASFLPNLLTDFSAMTSYGRHRFNLARSIRWDAAQDLFLCGSEMHSGAST